ncbi:MAG: aminotransferase class I/II-fold pyridoxal phosphate-dependent enzyme [Oscillospiraceae bacterium]|jgi:aminotransferase|nr:aminotransferase class I/II-fold pyridoxal phosphate-dependent enzyme [Oscillospiraceae bacterium]
MNYDKMLSAHVMGLKPSGIRKFFDIAESIPDVISLSVGEPDFKTPWAIRAQAIGVIEKGRTNYTSNAGLARLRAAVSEYVKRKTRAEYSPDSEVLITVGGSEAIDLSVRALINPGDEVIVPEPCFVCYSPIVKLAGGVPVPAVTREEERFKLTPETLKKLITPATKALFLPFPNNPTGAVLRRAELEAIAEIIEKTEIAVISDEIYSELTYGEPHVSIAQIGNMRERVIVINGFSKSFAMTGWRLGFACAPAPIIAQMTKIHQYAVMCSPTISQHAAVTALNDCEDEVRAMAEEYDARRRLVVKGFADMGLECFEPEGAFYVFPSIKSTGMDSRGFCTRLVKEKSVAVVPGNAFGDSGEGYVRVCYAYSLKHLTTALKRIEEFLKAGFR